MTMAKATYRGKKSIYFGLWFQRVRVPNGRDNMTRGGQYGCRSRNVRTHILSHTPEAGRGTGSGRGILTSALTPRSVFSLSKVVLPKRRPIVPPIGDQVFNA